MASLTLEGVGLDYPIYNVGAHSLSSRLIRIGTGGTIERAGGGVVLVHALRNFSLSLRDGDALGLLGRNGAGKSSLLRVMAGVYPPSSGRVRREGRVGTMFDLGVGIEPELTGYQNIRRAGLLHGMSPREIASKIGSIEAFTELGDFLSLPVRTYSAGMRTRLSFAIVTAAEPDILLIDEVIGAGDAQFREKAQARIESLAGRARIVVVTSHSVDVIKRFCNKAALLDKGELVAMGGVDEISARYVAAAKSPVAGAQR